MSAAPVLALVPKRMSLYELVRDTEGIADLVDALDRDGELTPELSAELSEALIHAISGTKSKVDRCCGVLASFEAAEAAAKVERDRLDVRAKYFSRQRERLESYCLAVLDASNLPRIDGDTATLARRRNPGRVVIDDESVIPWDFMRLPEPPPPPDATPDKKLIAAALKSDPESVPGARIETSFRLVRS